MTFKLDAKILLRSIGIDSNNAIFQQKIQEIKSELNNSRDAKSKQDKIDSMKRQIFAKLVNDQELQELLQKFKEAIAKGEAVVNNSGIEPVSNPMLYNSLPDDLDGLIKIHAALATKVKEKSATVSPANPFDFLTPIQGVLVEILKYFLSRKLTPGGLLDQFTTNIHKDNVQRNPKIELHDREKEASKYSELFDEIDDNGEGRALYRQCLNNKFTEEQQLNKFLRLLANNTPENGKKKLYTKPAHLLLAKAENLLLADRSADQIAAQILQDFNTAIAKAYNGDASKTLDTEKPGIKDHISGYIKDLVNKIHEQKLAIIEKEHELSREEKIKLYHALQNNRVKLVNEVAKLTALSKGQLLSTNPKKSKKFNIEYIRHQLEKFEPPPVDPAISHIPTGIRQLFVGGSRDKGLANQDEFTQALTRVQDERIQELKAQEANIRSTIGTLKGLALTQEKKVTLLEKNLEEARQNKHTALEKAYSERIVKIKENIIDIKEKEKKIRGGMEEILTTKLSDKIAKLPTTSAASSASEIYTSLKGSTTQHYAITTELKQLLDDLNQEANVALKNCCEQQQPQSAPQPNLQSAFRAS